MKRTKIALAFSGGVESSWASAQLHGRLGYDVVTVLVDTGGLAGRDHLRIKTRALGELAGAGHYVVDVKDVAWEYILAPVLRANLVSPTGVPEWLAGVRMLQAREVARVAGRAGAEAVAYGSAAGGLDAVLFEAGLRIYAPGLPVIDPGGGEFISRDEKLRYLAERRVTVDARSAAVSTDCCLWSTTLERKVWREDWDEPLAELLPEPTAPRPSKPADILLGFEAGLPVTVDGAPLQPVALCERLAALGRLHRVGRGSSYQATVGGLRRRVAHDAPLPAILTAAHRELEALVLTPDQLELGALLSRRMHAMLNEGRFYDPAVRDMEAFFEHHQRRVSGEVLVRLEGGSVHAVAANSPHALTDELATPLSNGSPMWKPRDLAGYAKVNSTTSFMASRIFGDESESSAGD